MDRTPILVTGAPRSGTTFLGWMLALPRGVTYVDEPFNYQMGMQGVNQQFLYLYKGSVKEEYYAGLLRRLLAGRAKFKRHALDVPPVGMAASVERWRSRSRQRTEYKLTGLEMMPWRYLLKDPMAAFSAEYLHREFGMPTIIIVRHPAAVVGSFRRLGWRFGLTHLTQQPALMRQHLQPILGDVNPHTVSDVEEGALLWASVYKVLCEYADRNPNIIVLRHEDLSAEPEKTFHRLYKQLKLPLTPWASGQIREYTSSGNAATAPSGVAHALRRHSGAIASKWHDGLTPPEVSRIRELTAPVADRFYGPEDWRQSGLS